MIVCLFDIDGTLLNSGGAGQAAMELALAAHFNTNRALDGISTAGRTDRAIVADMFAALEIKAGDEEWTRFLTTYLEFLPNELRSRDGLVLPGVRELLDALSQRPDVSLGLLTGNFAAGARLKLAHFGLSDHFAFGGFGDHHCHRDDVAREALGQARTHHEAAVSADQIWVIGDTPADVQCARAIGAHVVAVATGMYSAAELIRTNPDHLLDDFSDSAAVLSLFV